MENISESNYLNSLKNIDKKDLFKLYYENKDIELRNEIVNRYLYIAEILSKKYANKGIEYEDLYQVASLGLILAIERFDINRGFEFTSFATPTIIGEIKKYFRDKGWSIRVPRRIQELSKKVNIAKNILNQRLKNIPKVADIADYLDCTQEQVLEAMEASNVYNPKSLDLNYESNGDNKEIQLKDLIGEDDIGFNTVENKDFIKENMKKLNEIELRILKGRFFENKKQTEIAKELNVSQMTISRMEKKIIEKFKKELDKVI